MTWLKFNYVDSNGKKVFCRASGTVEGLTNFLNESKELADENNATVEDIKWE
ncbi:hypothetical protein DSECCO2_565040 [anaerobic digester metagenome]|nr:hypothetical protein [uncultured Methanobacterium sp.]